MNMRSVAIAAMAMMIAGPSLAAPKPRVNEVCLADFHKLCSSEALGRGVVIRCARAHIDQVAPDCKTAVEAANALNEARRAAKAARRTAAKADTTKAAS
jgi:hypothetical protein